MTIIVTPVTPVGYQTQADWYDLLMPELPGCTTALLDIHLDEIIREFCTVTSAWRTALVDVVTAANQAAYQLDTGLNGAEIVRVTKLTVNDLFLWRLNEDEDSGADEEHPKYERHEPPFTMSNSLATLTLATLEIPSAAGTLSASAALRPEAGAYLYPEFLKQQYSEPIRCGVLARMMVMGKKPWADRQLAVGYGSRWNQLTSFAAYQAQVNNTRQPLRTKKWG